MILVILLISLALTITGCVIYYKGNYDTEGFGFGVGVVGGITFTISMVATIVLGVEALSLSVVDDKIAMYQEENNKIETQIAEIVKQYQEYEKDIFIEVSPESAVTLVSLYPELKSDSLVQKQIEVYVANNETIKTLKESKINGNVVKWWLYFGG